MCAQPAGKPHTKLAEVMVLREQAEMVMLEKGCLRRWRASQTKPMEL